MPDLERDQQILAADEARYQALYRQDVEALDHMLAEDYVHAHANGHVDDRVAFLASIRSGPYRFVMAERSRQQVRHAGSVSLLHGVTETTLDVAGQLKVMRNAFVTVWVQRSGTWQLLHWQATRMPES